MNYKELQNQLKTFKSQGLTTIALNAKKDVLEKEYDRVMNAMLKDALATEPEIIEDTEIETINESLIIATEIIETAIITPEIFETKIVATDNEIIEDCSIELITPEIKIENISIANEVNNEAVNVATDNETQDRVTNAEFITALSKLLIIFVSSIVKLWCQVNLISQLTKVFARSIDKAQSDINKFTRWYLSGFTLPSFV